VGEVVTVRAERPVAGGACLSRMDSGLVVLVRGALPGERVDAVVDERRGDAVLAELRTVLEASADRVRPPCPHVARGCGGCDQQHATLDAQRAAKVEVVRDALRRLGHVAEPVIDLGLPLASTGFRTTVRAAVANGRAGLRAHHSHDVVPLDSCEVAHPLVEELLVRGRFGGATEVTIRVGAGTGDRLVIAAPTVEGIEVPEGVAVTSVEALHDGQRAWIHEVVGGRTFRISARSFFQSRPDGAEALVDAVVTAAGESLVAGSSVLDAYGGAGLFSALLHDRVPGLARVELVERNASSVADARVNLADTGAVIVRSDVDRWRPHPFDVVVADPARAGVGKVGADRLVRTGADVIVLVSCDAASLGRDARLFADRGYGLERSTLVDLFPHTHHVEVVSRLVRAAG